MNKVKQGKSVIWLFLSMCVDQKKVAEVADICLFDNNDSAVQQTWPHI